MKADQGGFSLLELMVAFTLLALSIGVLMEAFGGGVNLISNAADQARVVSLARSQLNRVGREWPVEVGQHSGEWDQYRWQVVLDPYETGGGISNLRQARLLKVTVLVSWQDRDRQRRYTLTSLRMAPPS